MQIDPRVAIALNIAYGILAGLSVPAIEALGFRAHASVIYAWAGLVALILNAVMHGYSSSAPGPLAPADKPVVAAAETLANLPATARPTTIDAARAAVTTAAAAHVVNGFLVGAMIVAGLMALGLGEIVRPARAGESPGTFNLATTKGLVTGTAASTQANAAGALAGALGDVVNFFATDFDEAAKLATEIPGLQDNNGRACWVQAGSVGALLKLHPLPVTFKQATDYEALRLFSMAINQMCANPACTQVFTDLSNGVAQIGVGIPIPSLTAICAKIPNITPGVPASVASAPAAN